MEKKYFLVIPVFFLLFSFLFPFSGGIDRYLVKEKAAGPEKSSKSRISAYYPFPGRERTCYLETDSFAAAGFLDGTLLINENNSGFKPLDNRVPGKFQTVYSIAVSSDAKYLAVISGVNPRTLSVYQKKQDGWSLEHRVSMQEDERSSTYLSFSGNLLLYEDASGISVLSLATFKPFTLAFEGDLEDVAFGPEHEYVWVLASDSSGKRAVNIFLYDGSLIASAPYDGSDRLMAYRLAEQ